MESGKIVTIIAAIITILGTYVFAIFGATPIAFSGIGFITNLGILFGNATPIAVGLGLEVWIYYIIIILLIIFLAAGALQLLGLKSRVAGFIFALFPIVVGVMIVLLAYTTILGPLSAFFTYAFIGEQFGSIFPFIVPLGTLGLGTYLLLAGGALGIVGVFLPRD
jgi:hypothetical protein